MSEDATSMKRLAEDIIVFLEASDVTAEKLGSGFRPWETKYGWADRCVPMTSDGVPDGVILMPDECEEMFWPKWVPIAMFTDDEGPDAWGKGTIQISALQPCNAVEARKAGADLFASVMALSRVCIVTANGDRRAVSKPVRRVGGKWVSAIRPRQGWGFNGKGDPIPNASIDHNFSSESDNAQFGISQGVLLGLRYRWTVTLRIGGSVGVRLPVRSCASIPELFRLRDVPPGKSRRSKLRHWVETHWRAASNNEDSDMLTLVRKHLRGGTRFSWSGMGVEIDPADYDLERLEAIKAWRDSLRGTGEDRLVRRTA